MMMMMIQRRPFLIMFIIVILATLIVFSQVSYVVDDNNNKPPQQLRRLEAPRLEEKAVVVVSGGNNRSSSDHVGFALTNGDRVASYPRLIEGVSSLIASHNRRHLAVICGTPGPINGRSHSDNFDLVGALANYYSTYCSNTITVLSSSDSTAVSQICGGGKDVAFMTRTFFASEAIVQSSGYTYKCKHIDKKMNEIIVATKGSVARYNNSPGGVAASCINSLGGLTIDQVRWIFSSFTTSQLIASGWNRSSVPRSDGNDTTHLWSELGGTGCPAKEIRIAGFPVASKAYRVFNKVVFNGRTKETIATNRPYGYYNGVTNNNEYAVAAYVYQNTDAIGLFAYKSTSTTLPYASSLRAVPIKNKQGKAITPTPSSFATCGYPICQAGYVYFSLKSYSLPKTKRWLKFFYTTEGDQVIVNQGDGWNPVTNSLKSYFNTHQLS